MDEVKVIFFGPSERIVAFDTAIQKRIKMLQESSIEILACKGCADRMQVTTLIERLGIKVMYVGPVISQLLK